MLLSAKETTKNELRPSGSQRVTQRTNRGETATEIPLPAPRITYSFVLDRTPKPIFLQSFFSSIFTRFFQSAITFYIRLVIELKIEISLELDCALDIYVKLVAVHTAQ